MTVEYATQCVEQAIASLGVDLNHAKTGHPQEWKLKFNEIDVLLYLKNSQSLQGNRFVFLVVCPLMKLKDDPEQRYALFQDLLSVNHQLVVSKFSIANDILFLSAGRDTKGMDPAELNELIQQNASNASLLVKQLKEKYS